MRPTHDLDPFKAELKSLHDAGETIPKLTEYLASQGVHVGRSTLWRRCKAWGWGSQTPLRVRQPRDPHGKELLEQRITALFHERRSDKEIVEILEREASETGSDLRIGSRRAVRRLRKARGMRHRKYNGEAQGDLSASASDATYVKERRRVETQHGTADDANGAQVRTGRGSSSAAHRIPIDPRLPTEPSESALIEYLWQPKHQSSMLDERCHTGTSPAPGKE